MNTKGKKKKEVVECETCDNTATIKEGYYESLTKEGWLITDGIEPTLCPDCYAAQDRPTFENVCYCKSSFTCPCYEAGRKDRGKELKKKSKNVEIRDYDQGVTIWYTRYFKGKRDGDTRWVLDASTFLKDFEVILSTKPRERGLPYFKEIKGMDGCKTFVLVGRTKEKALGRR